MFTSVYYLSSLIWLIIITAIILIRNPEEEERERENLLLEAIFNIGHLLLLLLVRSLLLDPRSWNVKTAVARRISQKTSKSFSQSRYSLSLSLWPSLVCRRKSEISFRFQAKKSGENQIKYGPNKEREGERIFHTQEALRE